MYVLMPLGPVPEVLRKGGALCKPPSMMFKFSFNNWNEMAKAAFT